MCFTEPSNLLYIPVQMSVCLTGTVNKHVREYSTVCVCLWLGLDF